MSDLSLHDEDTNNNNSSNSNGAPNSSTSGSGGNAANANGANREMTKAELEQVAFDALEKAYVSFNVPYIVNSSGSPFIMQRYKGQFLYLLSIIIYLNAAFFISPRLSFFNIIFLHA